MRKGQRNGEVKIITRLIRYLYYHSFIRFLTVGVIALASDAATLYALRGEMGLIPAKIVSYMVALTVGWLLNRYFTFKSSDSKAFHEWLRYGVIYIGTGVIHVSIFALLTYHSLHLYHHPIFALLITAGIVAVINYFLSKRFAFIAIATQQTQ